MPLILNSKPDCFSTPGTPREMSSVQPAQVFTLSLLCTNLSLSPLVKLKYRFIFLLFSHSFPNIRYVHHQYERPLFSYFSIARCLRLGFIYTYTYTYIYICREEIREGEVSICQLLGGACSTVLPHFFFSLFGRQIKMKSQNSKKLHTLFH